jgi:hypothetical protein
MKSVLVTCYTKFYRWILYKVGCYLVQIKIQLGRVRIVIITR